MSNAPDASARNSRLREALEGRDWVFHAAAYYPTDRQRHADAVAHGIASTQRVLAQIRDAKPQRVVFTSSAAIIRHVAGRPATEVDAESWPPQTERSLYATVKIALEHEVLSASRQGLPVVVVNPSICIGEYDAHAFSGRAVLAFAKHQLPWYLEHQFNLVYTGDVGIAQVRAAERGRIGERYLLTNDTMSLHAFGTLVASIAGTRPPRWKVPYGVAWTAAAGLELLAWLTRSRPALSRDMVRLGRSAQVLDGSKAQRELGLPHTPIEETVRRALTWFRAHGYA